MKPMVRTPRKIIIVQKPTRPIVRNATAQGNIAATSLAHSTARTDCPALHQSAQRQGRCNDPAVDVTTPPYQAEDSGDHKSCSQFLPDARRPYSSSARLAGKNSRAASKCVCPGMCRFLDAGMPRRSTRLGGRRSKSAKARNRGKGYVLRCGVRYRELSSARNFGFEAGRFSPAASLE